MQTLFTKREQVFSLVATVSLVAAIGLGIYASGIRQDQTKQNQRSSTILNENNSKLLEMSNYNDTICAEYRKLYQAYTEVLSHSPSANATYALPGSAKGQIDPCYQPE